MSSLIRRLAGLVRADAHGVVDALEDRRLSLRQNLREAELELDRKRARVSALDAEERSLAVDRERLSVAMASLDEDVELALAGDKEELARFSLRKLIPLRGESTRLGERRAASSEERERLAARLAVQEEEFEGLKLRVKLSLARSADEEQGTVKDSSPVADEEVELELLRRREDKAPRRRAKTGAA